MQFVIYDNESTYDKMHPSRHMYPETDLSIKQIAITPWNSFWFETDFEKEDHNVNINAPYVHLHKGIKSLNSMQFDNDPYYIDLKSAIYDPKKRQLLIYKPNTIMWNPWKKPLFVKNVRHNYYGSELPLKPTKTLGKWKFDYSQNSIHIILDYYGGYRTKS